MEQEIDLLGKTLLRTGSLLQANGACTERTRVVIDRIARVYGRNAEISITNRAIELTVTSSEGKTLFTGITRSKPIGVNFTIFSEISKLSLSLLDKSFGIEEFNSRLDRIAESAHYNRWLISVGVALAGSGFCFVAGGNSLALCLCFIATFMGINTRMSMHKIGFNPFICVFAAAFVASFCAGAGKFFITDIELTPALATSVLFLVPGVPLINSFIDLTDGNILNGIMRAVNGLIMSFMIAMGMMCSLLIFNFS
ncbi:MAG: threonine/serine exporter family protein [Marinifilaceae bacterium]|jgi:uncharacterized membrane protein YjjP (DUF1212 family)|nr:threonine/serine exporter family protein [Marinifilaceae bacterium]